MNVRENRSRTIVLGGWVVLVVLSSLGRAQVDQSTAERAKGLIAALSAEDFAARDAAFEELAALGAAVRPLLLGAVEGSDPETRLRLETLIGRLPTESEEAPSVELLASRVSLDVRRAEVEAVLAALESRSLVRFARPLGVDAPHLLDLRLDEVPILEALDRLAQLISARWMTDAGAGVVRFYPAGNARPLVSYHGPLRLALTQINRTTSLLFGEEQRENCYLQMQIDLEPGSPILAVEMPPAIKRLETATGANLYEEGRVRPFLNPSEGRPNFMTSLALGAWAADDAAIAVVEGEVKVVVAATYRQIDAQVPPPDAPIPDTTAADGVALQFIAHTVTQGVRILRFSIHRERLFLDPERTRQLAEQQIDVTDAAGQIVEIIGRPARSLVGDAEQFTLRLGQGEPARITFKSVTSVEERRIPFRFTDVPLPR